MRILKFIPVILITLSACNSNEEYKLNDQAEAVFNEGLERSRAYEEQLSKSNDSIDYEIDRRGINEVLEKAKKYKFNAGSNCSCINTYSITNTNEITNELPRGRAPRYRRKIICSFIFENPSFSNFPLNPEAEPRGIL